MSDSKLKRKLFVKYPIQFVNITTVLFSRLHSIKINKVHTNSINKYQSWKKLTTNSLFHVKPALTVYMQKMKKTSISLHGNCILFSRSLFDCIVDEQVNLHREVRVTNDCQGRIAAEPIGSLVLLSLQFGQSNIVVYKRAEYWELKLR